MFATARDPTATPLGGDVGTLALAAFVLVDIRESRQPIVADRYAVAGVFVSTAL